MMSTLWQDIRYGFRMLVKRPGFTGVAVLTLSLGIGANTAIFSVINSVLIRPLPFRDAGGIMTLWQNNKKSGIERDGVSPANFLDWREQNQVFEEVSAIEPFSHDLTGNGEPETFRSWIVSAGFFQILGTGALYGRTFLPEEYEAGHERVVVIGYRLWQRRFGSDPNLVGQTLVLRGQPYTVVGVLPPEFQFMPERELWAPRVERENDRQNREASFLNVIARLKPGIGVEQARADMNGITARLAQQYPDANREVGATVVSLPEQLLGHIRPALLVLLGAVGLVLLIACANVANLLLVRATEREREFAIRTALGAGRTRLIRQLFTESACLALMGGAGGVLLSIWGVDAILALSPDSLPRINQVGIDGRVLAFALGVSVLTAFVFGLVPSLQFSKPDLQEALKEGGRSATAGLRRHRLRNVLVISEIALALMLLVGAGLLIRSFTKLLQVEPGFATNKVMALEVRVGNRLREPQQKADFYEQAIDRIASLPGVEAAGATTTLPLIKYDIDTTFTIEGGTAPGQEYLTYLSTVSADYFRAMSIPLRRGRTFTGFDNADAQPVLLINEMMARRYWPGDEPLGKKITLLFMEPKVYEIAGVVGDVRHDGLQSDPRPEVFLHYLQSPPGSMHLVVRTSADPLLLLPDVKNQLWSVYKEQPIARIATIEQLLSESLQERRFTLAILGSFALIALMLTGVGVYGLISFSTRQRTHEIGVRMALGARGGDILKMIIRQGLILTLSGVGLGLLGAMILTRFLQSMLFGVSATDPATFIIISLLLAAVALVASYIPARRAMRVDPMVALRYE